MERGGTRVGAKSAPAVPDFAALDPGYGPAHKQAKRCRNASRDASCDRRAPAHFGEIVTATSAGRAV